MIGVCKNNNTADDNFIWDYLLSIIYEKRRKGIKEEGQKKRVPKPHFTTREKQRLCLLKTLNRFSYCSKSIENVNATRKKQIIITL